MHVFAQVHFLGYVWCTLPVSRPRMQSLQEPSAKLDMSGSLTSQIGFLTRNSIRMRHSTAIGGKQQSSNFPERN
jgi:hypothetical protein